MCLLWQDLDEIVPKPHFVVCAPYSITPKACHVLKKIGSEIRLRACGVS